ncbi:unnamed protein product [Natator depressus]
MNRQFVEDRAVAIDLLPFIWNVKGPGPHCCLDMKMSWLKRLAFAFEFGSVNPRQSFPVTEFPERIVKLDISLNELEELQPEALFPFENLSDLDASLNALGIIRGVEVLPNLVVLNLSHNALSDLRSLETCIHLSVLNVSHNQVRALGDMPLLSHLTRLHLGSNKLRSLEGIQILPQLCELYVQKNRISSLLPLSSSLALNILGADSNEIGSLQQALHVLGGLRRLRHLKLQGDLREELREYEETFRTEVDGSIRYIDALPSEDIQGLVNPQEIPNAMEKYLFTKFWERWQHGRRKPANIPYKELTKPEEG